MPPGNSSNKPAVVERCSYCKSPTCSGERSHVRSWETQIYYDNLRTSTSEALQNRTTTSSIRTTPVTPKPAVVPSKQLPGSSGYVSSNNAVGSTAVSVISTKSTDVRTNQLSGAIGDVGSNKTVGSTHPSAITRTQTVTPYSQSTNIITNAGSSKSVGSTNRSQVNSKPLAPNVPAQKPAVVISNQSESTIHEHRHSNYPVVSNKTISTSFCNDSKTLASKREISLSCGTTGTNDTLAESKIQSLTSFSGTNSTVPSLKPVISSPPCDEFSGTVIAHPSNVSNVSTSKHPPTSVTSASDRYIPSIKQESVNPLEALERSLGIKVVNSELMQGREYQHAKGNDSDLQDPLKKHSRSACIFRGTVAKFIGTRIAEVKIDKLDGSHKLAQLLVEKFSFHKNAPACAASANIRTVLRVGDVITLVCTDHRRKGSSFDYFAHQAWKKDDDSSLNNNWVNNDTESVNSFASHASLPDSENRQTRSRRGRGRNKVTNEQTSVFQGVDISQWLANNSMSPVSCQYQVITEGHEHLGKVVKLRLPFAFLVEVELLNGPQCIFVYSKYFYPDGPNSSSMMQGLSIKDVVSIGDSITVIPLRFNQNKAADYEWVAKKAWPSGKKTIANEESKNNVEKFSGNNEESVQSKISDFVWVKSDQCGAILSLQTDWGLVRELKNDRVFVFSRKNSYLFGLSLRNFVLEDVLQEGEMVKFSQEEGERGEINANLLYYGSQLPDFNSFVEAIHNYCEKRNIKQAVETELTMQGEVMFSLK